MATYDHIEIRNAKCVCCGLSIRSDWFCLTRNGLAHEHCAYAIKQQIPKPPTKQITIPNPGDEYEFV